MEFIQKNVILNSLFFLDAYFVIGEIEEFLPDERIAQWSIRWILDHPAVTTVIPGASKISQVKTNMAAADLPSLPNEIHSKLRELYDEKIKPAIRGHY